MQELNLLMKRLFPSKKSIRELLGSKVEYRGFEGIIYAFSMDKVVIVRRSCFVEVHKNEFFRIEKYQNDGGAVY